MFLRMVLIYFIFQDSSHRSASALPESAVNDFFAFLDENNDGKLTLLDLNTVAAGNNIAMDDCWLIEQILTASAADTDSGKTEINLEEFRDGLNHLDYRWKILAAIQPSGKDGQTQSGLLAYVRKLEPVLAMHGARIRCKRGYFRSRYFCYMPVSGGLSFDRATATCAGLGASLPNLDDSAIAEDLRAIMRARNYYSRQTLAFWLNLRKTSGSSANEGWTWESGRAVDQEKLPWRSNEPNGASELNGRGSVQCSVAYLSNDKGKDAQSQSASSETSPRWFADEACDVQDNRVGTICQRRPDFVDVDISRLNQNVTDADIEYGEIELEHGTVKAGKSPEEIAEINHLLRELNRNKAANEYIDADKAQGANASLVQDVIPQSDCLANRVRNTACVPSAGRRRKRGKCNDRRRKRTAFLKKNLGWDQKPTVRYAFQKTIPKWTKKQALRVMEYWSKQTCVDFVDSHSVSADDIPDVIIARKKGCWSSIGRDTVQKELKVNGKEDADGVYSKGDEHPQILSLGTGCDKFYIVAHEFGHLLGLDHEQSRPDRYDYIQINHENIDPNFIYNFDSCGECCEEPTYPYDFGSIMHYSISEFSAAKGLATISDKTPDQLYNNTMGNAWYPSFHDVAQVNQLLCNESCPEASSAVCENSGYPHPRNCEACICPTGFAGAKCESIEPGEPEECGGELEATDEPQNITSPGFPTEPLHFQQCSWIIRAPRGYQVEIDFDRESFSLSDDCRAANVQIKFKKDLSASGPFFCNKEPPPSQLRSESETMLVLLRVNTKVETPMRGFSASYRAVSKCASSRSSSGSTDDSDDRSPADSRSGSREDRRVARRTDCIDDPSADSTNEENPPEPDFAVK